MSAVNPADVDWTVDWTVECPICGKQFDSHDSYADSRAMVRAHIEAQHPEARDDQ